MGEPRRHLHEQNLRRMHPRSHTRERSGPGSLQDLVRSCNLKQIGIIMKALETEEEYL